jgi:hypothetical protein
MKSRIRPPLNLSHSDLRGRTRLRSPATGNEDRSETHDDLGILKPYDKADRAMFEADETEQPTMNTPETELEVTVNPSELSVQELSPEPEAIKRSKEAETSQNSFVSGYTSPPPEPSPPVAHVLPKKPTKTSEALTPLGTVAPKSKGVLRFSGGSNGLFWGTVTLISLIWATSIVAFVLGAEQDLNAFSSTPFRLVILGALAIFPIGLIFASAFALRHAAALSRESQRASALADAMIGPAAVASGQAVELVNTLRQQVDQAVQSVKIAHNDLMDLSQKMRSETEALHQASQLARHSTAHITDAIGLERLALTDMGKVLDLQAQGVIEAVDRQARMVSDASDLAQTQLREAEAVLAARAADLASTASDAHDTARIIAEDLGRQTLRLETAGAGVADQIRSVEEGLSQQRAGLVSAALSLRADQEDFAVHLENQRAQLTEALNVTRTATADLGETSSRGVGVLRDLVVHAQDQFRQVLNGAENERTSFETRIHSTLSNISLMAADARDELVSETRKALEQLSLAADDSRKAAESAALSATNRVDRLNETLFEAGKKADEAFDARFMAARRLIEDSAVLIEEAGEKTGDRLDQSFAMARQGIAEVDAALTSLNARADELPLQAKSRLEEIRRSVEDGLLAMTEAARKASIETESVDQAFQERVRRNYEMLSEAVKLMGVLGSQPLPTAAPSGPNPYVERFDRPKDMPRPQRQRASISSEPETNTPETAAPRIRLRSDTEASKPSGRQTAQTPEAWSWRDLLSGMEGQEKRKEPPLQPNSQPQRPAPPIPDPDPVPYDNLDDLMIGEVEAMGVDAPSLLSRARIDEVVAAIVAEDNEGARLVVRRVGPSAIRRISRRLMTDVTLREQAHEFVTYYDRQINIALMTREPHIALSEVLANDTGRTYLLFDAAISELI